MTIKIMQVMDPQTSVLDPTNIFSWQIHIKDLMVLTTWVQITQWDVGAGVIEPDSPSPL
jgi:hypothetical protein